MKKSMFKKIVYSVLVLTLLTGCIEEKNSSKQKSEAKKSAIVKKENEKFYGIEMLGKMDLKKFSFIKDQNNSELSTYKMNVNDELFDSVEVGADKKHKVLKIILTKDVGQFGDPYAFANDIIVDLKTKYGSFNCIPDNIQFVGKIGETCTNNYKDNVIELSVFHFSSQNKVFVKYTNKEYAKHNLEFSKRIQENIAKSKL